MDVKIGLLALLVLTGGWVSNARNFAESDLLGADNADANIDMCSLCKEYATAALDYLADDKTQAQVLEALHNTCFQLHGLKEQCTMLVDYYAPLFFLEVSSVQPEGLCKKVGLCRNAGISSLSSTTDKCEACHQAVDDILDKLKDPDTKLGIIELLLKTCNLVEKYSKKCKSLVFEFGPLILTDAEKFIEKTDICTKLHACRKSKVDAKEAAVDGKIEMVTSS